MKKLKELLEKVKTLFKKILLFLTKAWQFLKKWGLFLLNLLMLFAAYDYDSDSVLVGLWILALGGYLIYRLFKKDAKKNEKPPSVPL